MFTVPPVHPFTRHSIRNRFGAFRAASAILKNNFTMRIKDKSNAFLPNPTNT